MANWHVQRIAKDTNLILGQIESNGRNGAVLTVVYKGERFSKIHGFLSREKLTFPDFIHLWIVIRDTFNSRYFVFEVLPGHASFYKAVLHIERSRMRSTFDGFESELIIISRDAQLKKRIQEFIHK